MKDDDLTQTIIGCAYKAHNALGPGFLEKVYEDALRIELENLGLSDEEAAFVELKADSEREFERVPDKSGPFAERVGKGPTFQPITGGQDGSKRPGSLSRSPDPGAVRCRRQAKRG